MLINIQIFPNLIDTNLFGFLCSKRLNNFHMKNKHMENNHFDFFELSEFLSLKHDHNKIDIALYY
jgi:hypothetical protein